MQTTFLPRVFPFGVNKCCLQICSFFMDVDLMTSNAPLSNEVRLLIYTPASNNRYFFHRIEVHCKPGRMPERVAEWQVKRKNETKNLVGNRTVTAIVSDRLNYDLRKTRVEMRYVVRSAILRGRLFYQLMGGMGCEERATLR